MFTIQNTPNEIFSDTQIRKYLSLFFQDFMLSPLTEDAMDKPLTYARDHLSMPWGGPFLADQLAESANRIEEILTQHSLTFISLYKEKSWDFFPDFSANDLSSVSLITTNTRTLRRKPAVLILPGGGYRTLSVMLEGIDYAHRFEEKGYQAFVLLNRVAPNIWPSPMLDTALAMKYLRSHAEEWHIDPDRILLVGSSAGGHLAASYAADYPLYDTLLLQALQHNDPKLAEKYRNVPISPNRLLLCYPVISFLSEAHEDSFTALTGGMEDPQLRRQLSVETRVDAAYPETFVWACSDDDLVPVSNALRMGEALERAGVRHALKIYPQGGHGCGLAKGTSAESWFDEAMDFFSTTEDAPFEYFAHQHAEKTWMIGCDCMDFGRRLGKDLCFDQPTGNAWLIEGDDFCILLDTPAPLAGLRNFAETFTGKPVHLFLSHAHPDHTYRIGEFQEVWMHADDIPLLRGAYGWEACEQIPETLHELMDTDLIHLGSDHTLSVIHFPGHTDGSILLLDNRTKLLFSGDTIARRLLYGTAGLRPLKDFLEQLKSLKALNPNGICSIHDRVLLPPSQMDFILEHLPDLLFSEEIFQVVPEMDPLIILRAGDPKELHYLDASFPARLKEKIRSL